MPSEASLILLAGLLLDLLIGDPQWRCHPIRLLGDISRLLESGLRLLRLRGYLGGLIHLLGMLALPLTAWWLIHLGLSGWHTYAAWTFDVLCVASLLCNRDLIDHGRRIHGHLCKNDIPAARQALSFLVGRDTAPLDAAAIRRATVESLSESIVDGIITPLLAYGLAGMPGLIAIKVVSTLDSMVGYRNERYRRFGMWAARLDDLVHFLPARLAPLLLASLCPLLGLSARHCLSAAWRWHAMLPSPNSGWIEAAWAGALRCRLLGPIWSQGELVNDAYLGDPDWPEDPGDKGLRKSLWAVALLTIATAAIAYLSTELLSVLDLST